MNNKNKDKVSWFTKLGLKYFPNTVLKNLAKDKNINNIVFDKLHDVFVKTNRVDIFPCKANSRGFILVLDKETALYFYQDGDHFVYDGFEMGEYDNGDVTIFDQIK